MSCDVGTGSGRIVQLTKNRHLAVIALAALFTLFPKQLVLQQSDALFQVMDLFLVLLIDGFDQRSNVLLG